MTEKIERLEVRLPNNLKDTIRSAANLVNKSLSAFVIHACLSKAYEIFDDRWEKKKEIEK